MGGRCGRFRRDGSALSPQRALLYFAVIPLLCTLMLAAPLVYFTNTNLAGQKVTLPSCSIVLETTSQGNWTLWVMKGRLNADDVTLLILNNATGARVLSSKINVSCVNFTWNDNNENGKFDTSDTILINQTGIGPGSTVMVLYKKSSVFLKELPGIERR